MNSFRIEKKSLLSYATMVNWFGLLYQYFSILLMKMEACVSWFIFCWNRFLLNLKKTIKIIYRFCLIYKDQ